MAEKEIDQLKALVEQERQYAVGEPKQLQELTTNFRSKSTFPMQ
jgi:hypothetical protein